MKPITNLRTLLTKEDWIVTIGLLDVYTTVLLHEEFTDHLAFKFQNQGYCFKVLPFDLDDVPRAFTKTLKDVIADIRSLSLKSTSLFGQLNSCSSNESAVYKTNSDCSLNLSRGWIS